MKRASSEQILSSENKKRSTERENLNSQRIEFEREKDEFNQKSYWPGVHTKVFIT